jgi:hypothetical protein
MVRPKGKGQPCSTLFQFLPNQAGTPCHVASHLQTSLPHLHLSTLQHDANHTLEAYIYGDFGQFAHTTRIILQLYRLNRDAIPEAMDPGDCLQLLKSVTCCQEAFALELNHRTLQLK